MNYIWLTIFSYAYDWNHLEKNGASLISLTGDWILIIYTYKVKIAVTERIASLLDLADVSITFHSHIVRNISMKTETHLYQYVWENSFSQFPQFVQATQNS